jgi:uncharacterized protein
MILGTNIQTVQKIYEAFGRGDVPAILELVSPNVEWEYAWSESPVPWLAPGKGRDHVASFFGVVAKELEFQSFKVNHLLEGDGVVVALASLEAIVKRTKKKLIEIDEAHIWHFDERGQVKKFRHGADTLQHARALEIKV